MSTFAWMAFWLGFIAGALGASLAALAIVYRHRYPVRRHW